MQTHLKVCIGTTTLAISFYVAICIQDMLYRRTQSLHFINMLVCKTREIVCFSHVHWRQLRRIETVVCVCACVCAVEHRKSLTACEGGVVIKRLMTLLEYPSDKVCYCAGVWDKCMLFCLPF